MLTLKIKTKNTKFDPTNTIQLNLNDFVWNDFIGFIESNHIDSYFLKMDVIGLIPSITQIQINIWYFFTSKKLPSQKRKVLFENADTCGA